MVLQKLTELYHELKSEGKIDPMGWAQVNIAYQLNLTNDGKVEEIRPYKCRESLPAPVRRTSHPTANFLWDNAMYLLGYPIGQKTKVDPKEYAAQCFEVSKKLHAEKLQDVDSPAAKAIVKFFETWDPENLNVVYGHCIMILIGFRYGRFCKMPTMQCHQRYWLRCCGLSWRAPPNLP